MMEASVSAAAEPAAVPASLPSIKEVKRVGSGQLKVRRQLSAVRRKVAQVEAEQEWHRRQAERIAEDKERIRLAEERVAEERAYEEAAQARVLQDDYRQERRRREQDGDQGPRAKAVVDDTTLREIQSELARDRATLDDLHRGDWVEREMISLKVKALKRRATLTGSPPPPPAPAEAEPADEDQPAGDGTSTALGLTQGGVSVAGSDGLICPPLDDVKQWYGYLEDHSRTRKRELGALQSDLKELTSVQKRQEMRSGVLADERRQLEAAHPARRVQDVIKHAERTVAADREEVRVVLRRQLSANRRRQQQLRRAQQQAVYIAAADASRRDAIAADPLERRRLEQSLLRERMAAALGGRRVPTPADVSRRRSEPVLDLRAQEQQAFAEERRAAARPRGSAGSRPPLPTPHVETGPTAAASAHAQWLASVHQQLAAAGRPDELPRLQSAERVLLSQLSDTGAAQHDVPEQQAATRSSTRPYTFTRPSSGRWRLRLADTRQRLREDVQRRQAESEAEAKRMDAELSALDVKAADAAARRASLDRVRKERRLLCSAARRRRVAQRATKATPPPSPPPPAALPSAPAGPWRGRVPVSSVREQQAAVRDMRRAAAEAKVEELTAEAAAGGVLERRVESELAAASAISAQKAADPDLVIDYGAQTRLARRLLEALLRGCLPGQHSNPQIALALAVANAEGPKLRLADVFYFDDSPSACQKAAELLPSTNIVQLVPGLQGQLLAVALERLLKATEAGAYPGLLCFDFEGALGEAVAGALEGGPSSDFDFAGGDRTVAQLLRLCAKGWRCAWVTQDDDDSIEAGPDAVARTRGVPFAIRAHGQAAHDARCDAAYAELVSVSGPSSARGNAVVAATAAAQGDEGPTPVVPLLRSGQPDRVLQRSLAQYRRHYPKGFKARFGGARTGFETEAQYKPHAAGVQWLRDSTAMLPDVDEKAAAAVAAEADAEGGAPAPAATIATADNKLAQLEQRVDALQRQLDGEREKHKQREAARQRRVSSARRREREAMEQEKHEANQQVEDLEGVINEHRRLVHRLQKGLQEIALPGSEIKYKELAATKIQARYRGHRARRSFDDMRRPPTPQSRGSSADWA